MQAIKETRGDEDVVFGIVGNKIDLFERYQVEKELGERMASSIGALFSEVSVKNAPKEVKYFIDKLIDKLLLNEKFRNKNNMNENLQKNIKLEKNNRKKFKERCMK